MICDVCNLPDLHSGRGDGIGSCECPRCECGEAAGSSLCNCPPEDPWAEPDWESNPWLWLDPQPATTEGADQ